MVVAADCTTLEMDTMATDSKGCAISGTSTDEGGALTNGQSRGTGVAVELRNGGIGVGLGNGVSNDVKAVATSGESLNDCGRDGAINEAQLFADHGEIFADNLLKYICYIKYLNSRINSIAIGERKTCQRALAT